MSAITDPSVIYADTITQVHGAVTSNFAMQVTDVRGALRCNCNMAKGRGWCEHLEVAVKDNLDKHTIPYGDPEQACMVNVPVVPSDGFWMLVMLTDLHKSGMSMVSVRLPTDEPNAEGPTAELGVMLNGAEGRAGLRRMVISWLGATSADLWCKSTLHRSTRWSRRDRGVLGSGDYKHAWSLIKSGFCENCASFSEFDDDIPEL